MRDLGLRFDEDAAASDPQEALLDLPLTSEDAEGEDWKRGASVERGPHRPVAWGWILGLVLALPLGGLIGYFLRLAPPIAALSTDLLDFGEVALGTTRSGLTVEVSNRGEAALHPAPPELRGEAAAAFLVTSDGCRGRELTRHDHCAVEVAFTPSERGEARAQLLLPSNGSNGTQTVPLVGSGTAPGLRIEPATLDFGEHLVGTASAASSFELVNTGTAPLTVHRLELGAEPGSADFVGRGDACSGRRLAPGGRCGVRFAFLPTAAGERAATLRIASDAREEIAAPRLIGRGLQPVPQLVVAPQSFDFGPLPLGASPTPARFSLSNPGSGPLALYHLEVTGDLFALAATDCAARLPAGGSCTVDVAFTAAAEGPQEATLWIRHDAGGGDGSEERLSLQGAGTAPHLSFEPAVLAFGEVPVRSPSPPARIRLLNSGTAPLALAEIAVEGADGSAFTLGAGCAHRELAPQAACLLEVGFVPRREGPHRAELRLRHDADTGHDQLPLNGLGVSPRLALSADKLDFGEVAPAAARERSLELRNRGRAPLRLERLGLDGSGVADFALTSDGCSGRTLAAAGRCQVEIRFAPRDGSAGTSTARLVVRHGAAGSPASVSLSGHCLPPSLPTP